MRSFQPTLWLSSAMELDCYVSLFIPISMIFILSNFPFHHSCLYFIYSYLIYLCRFSLYNNHILVIQMLLVLQGEARKTPWKSIFLCVPMWAILITQCGMSWIFYTELTELPTYMKNILHFDIGQVSILNILHFNLRGHP